MTSTEQSACRATASETLPRRIRRYSRPCEPTTSGRPSSSLHPRFCLWIASTLPSCLQTGTTDGLHSLINRMLLHASYQLFCETLILRLMRTPPRPYLERVAQLTTLASEILRPRPARLQSLRRLSSNRTVCSEQDFSCRSVYTERVFPDSAHNLDRAGGFMQDLF